MSFYRNDPNILNDDSGDFDRMGSVTRKARKNERPLFGYEENEFDETRGGNNFGQSNDITPTNSANFNQFVSDYAESGYVRPDVEDKIQPHGNGLLSDACGCLYKKGNPTPYKMCQMHFQNKFEQSRGFGIDSRYEMSLNTNMSPHQLQNNPRQNQFYNHEPQQQQQHQPQHQQQPSRMQCNCTNNRAHPHHQMYQQHHQFQQPKYHFCPQNQQQHQQHQQQKPPKPSLKCVGNQCRRL